MRSDRPRTPTYYLAAVLGVLIFIALLPVILPFLALYGLHYWLWGSFLKWRFRRTWGACGKMGVLVYSDSPHWKEYIESAILPRVADRVVTVNWSLRAQWKHAAPLEVQVFRHWSGSREYNPIAIIVPRRGRVQIIRFWQAFRDYKHGRPGPLETQQGLLFRVLEAA